MKTPIFQAAILLLALRIHVRTKGVWGLRPQPGGPPLHPVLNFISTAIS
jgi:hypothetical protein